ncbi:MAG: undecaprenyl-diphosphate phosphatase [Acidobacteriota bacterium]|nr:undecaprenyl-diphosphate phosphatase [Acidobacteriota bacterium]
MSPLQAVVLSLVQAVTEFLPISSSGHLILIPYFMGWPDQGLSFDIATNTGTLLAVMVYFRRELADLVTGFITGRQGQEEWQPRRFAWALVLATVPAAVFGLLFHHRIATQARNPILIASTAVFYGLLLLFADRVGREERGLDTLGLREALIIGMAQALALVPGTSRSGITITAALLLGFTRTAAARFSFLLSVPVGILVAVYDLGKMVREPQEPGQWSATVIAIVVSGLAGYLVIGWLLAWLRQRRLTVFVVYRLLLAAAIVTTVVLRH